MSLSAAASPPSRPRHDEKRADDIHMAGLGLIVLIQGFQYARRVVAQAWLSLVSR